MEGIREFKEFGIIDSLPKMTGIQAEGSKPIVDMFKSGIDILKPQKRAIRESGGMAESVTDEEILSAQKLLSRTEGIFVEPASASSIAGMTKLLEEEKIEKDEKIVCINYIKKPQYN